MAFKRFCNETIHIFKAYLVGLYNYYIRLHYFITFFHYKAFIKDIQSENKQEDIYIAGSNPA